MGKHVGKQALLDQATALFRAKGYTATSIDDVVKACGVTKGSLYYHFANKEELAMAAMAQVHAYFRSHIFSLLIDAERPGAAELAAFNQAVEAFFISHPDGCLLANLSLEIGASSPRFQAGIRGFFDAWRDCYLRVFAAVYPPQQAQAQAQDAVAIVHGCVLMHRINGDLLPLRRQHAALTALISDGGGGNRPSPRRESSERRD